MPSHGGCTSRSGGVPHRLALMSHPGRGSGRDERSVFPRPRVGVPEGGALADTASRSLPARAGKSSECTRPRSRGTAPHPP
jgi:hypothetical protein